jgi:hypothetical protein
MARGGSRRRGQGEPVAPPPAHAPSVEAMSGRGRPAPVPGRLGTLLGWRGIWACHLINRPAIRSLNAHPGPRSEVPADAPIGAGPMRTGGPCSIDGLDPGRVR